MKTPKLGMIIGYRVTEEDLGNANNNNNHQKVAPAIITAVWPGEYGEGIEGIGVNCRVFFDGMSVPIWKTSIRLGDQPGEYYFIEE